MAARSIASLTVSFGLVSIPVKLFSATEASKAISFNMLHKACGSRLKQQYLCLKEEIPVAREDMVKGYEFAKDQYVMFTPEELKAMEEVGTHTAEITEFVPLEASTRSTSTRRITSRPTRAAPSRMRCWPRRCASRTLRARPLGRARQAVHRDAAPGRGRPRHAAAPVRGRGALDQGYRDPADRGQDAGAEARAAC